MENLLYWAGMSAVAVNALTGVLDAGRKNMDLIGVMTVGAATAPGGGTVRDVLCNEVPLIFVRGELYASAAWTGALMLVGLQALGVSPVIAAWSGMAGVLGVRLLAMAFRITLPIYSERE